MQSFRAAEKEFSGTLRKPEAKRSKQRAPKKRATGRKKDRAARAAEVEGDAVQDGDREDHGARHSASHGASHDPNDPAYLAVRALFEDGAGGADEDQLCDFAGFDAIMYQHEGQDAGPAEQADEPEPAEPVPTDPPRVSTELSPDPQGAHDAVLAAFGFAPEGPTRETVMQLFHACVCENADSIYSLDDIVFGPISSMESNLPDPLDALRAWCDTQHLLANVHVRRAQALEALVAYAESIYSEAHARTPL